MAAERDGVLSLRALRACGLDDRAIARRVRDGRLHRLHRGVYAVGHPGLTLRGRFRAAVLACGAAGVLSHFAAAAFWGFWSWQERLVEVTIVGCGTRRVPGVRVHSSRGVERDVQVRDGIRVTTPARTLLDLAAVLPDKGLRRMVRRAQSQGAVSIRQIVELLERSPGHHGVTRLRAVVADGPAPTRTDLEDLLLDLLDRGRYRATRDQRAAALRHRDDRPGLPVARARRVAIEADSVTWHGHKLTREHDADKQAQLEAAGLRVLRITWAQITRSPQQTLARIRAALG